MGMLTKEDLAQIGGLLAENNKVLKTEIVTEVVSEVVLQVGEVLERNFNPQFEDIRGRLDRVENRLDRVEYRLDRVESRLEGVENKLDRTDVKVTTLVNVLERRSVITPADKRLTLS
jgi:archaellum component FlaC